MRDGKFFGGKALFFHGCHFANISLHFKMFHNLFTHYNVMYCFVKELLRLAVVSSLLTQTRSAWLFLKSYHFWYLVPLPVALFQTECFPKDSPVKRRKSWGNLIWHAKRVEVYLFNLKLCRLFAFNQCYSWRRDYFLTWRLITFRSRQKFTTDVQFLPNVLQPRLDSSHSAVKTIAKTTLKFNFFLLFWRVDEAISLYPL